MAAVPDFVTHYYMADRRPFLNLSDLDQQRRDAVMQDLIALRRAGTQARQFGQRYAQWRELTEARLRDQFIRAGGRPARLAPHYFVLGESQWFSRLSTNMQTVTLPVASLPRSATSFTLLDSFGAMGYAARFGFPDTAEAHQREVYLLEALERVVGRYGLPPGTDERYIEVQLWIDDPVATWLTGVSD